MPRSPQSFERGKHHLRRCNHFRQIMKWFTLIELLEIIAIISILAAILFLVFARAREKAWQTTCTSNQRKISASAQIYAHDHDEYLPSTAIVWQSLKIDTGVIVRLTENL